MKLILVVTPYLIGTNKFIYIVDNLPTSQYHNDSSAEHFIKNKNEHPNLFHIHVVYYW